MHHHELGKVIPVKVACKPRRLWMSKKWAKNDVVKKMQRGDHEDELVVLVPTVETVRKMDSGWVQNGQNKNEVDGLQIVSGPNVTHHLYYSRLIGDRSELELTGDFWTI